MKYKTEDELRAVVEGFENATIKRGKWGHPEHLIVAFYYAENYDFETALVKMRTGIFNLLKAFEVDLTKEMPYHETLTVFWMRTVFDFAQKNKNGSVIENLSTLIKLYDKDYPLKFYSREDLFSERARRQFVDPQSFQ